MSLILVATLDTIDSVIIPASDKDESKTTSPSPSSYLSFTTTTSQSTQDVEYQHNQSYQHKRADNRDNDGQKVARTDIATQTAGPQFPTLFRTKGTDVWMIDRC